MLPRIQRATPLTLVPVNSGRNTITTPELANNFCACGMNCLGASTVSDLASIRTFRNRATSNVARGLMREASISPQRSQAYNGSFFDLKLGDSRAIADTWVHCFSQPALLPTPE